MSVTVNQLNQNNTKSINSALASNYLNTKRVLDVVTIIAVLPFVAVLMAVTALAIKLESSGSVFFWQKRVGMNGKTFNMMKFRSMTSDSEQHGSQFAQSNDMRVTRVGKFIRKFRIDETPQLWNVIKGDMSIIGPRPEQESFVNEFNQTIPNYSLRHLVRPGITGLAQTEQGYVADADGTVTKLKYDLYYINNLSFMTDLQITLKTIYTILTGFGAR
ncbi:sugar transferase [Leucothrix mucor]|jgi:lipopolysaccharide/colanic/teichoic acid biosynthesis glycosyltransferase|uniref:sugar transferase n=1 Tax=Leucothrix mucor TaxID=45248 RepID=UPI0003B60734|nr:sugar transferase [Leucothrix mucor]